MPANRVLSSSRNNIYYGVSEGLIIKPPPPGFRVIVPSKYVAEECDIIDLKYEGIVPHGFNPNQFTNRISGTLSFRHRIAGDRTLFYCLGGYHLRKGYEELIKVARIVRQQMGCTFIIYLRLDRPNDLIEKYVDDLRDVLSIEYGAYKLSDRQVALEMMACDCYLIPSLAEGFYMPGLEAAYGCGKPVIYPDVSPYTDYLNSELGYPVPVVSEKIINCHLTPSVPINVPYRMRYWDNRNYAEAMIDIIEKPRHAIRKGIKAYQNRNKWTIYSLYKQFKKYLE
jgi:glycosyltransferase involved in cell wall biosynthesis